MWAALSWAAPKELGAQHRVHLRKAWRTSERWAPEEKEEDEEEDGDDGDAGAQESKADGDDAAPEPVRVLIDDFVGKIQEDEYLAAVLMEDVPVPTDPEPEDAEEDGE